MKQDDRPVTKAEFDEGMQMVTNAFENVATKEDLKAYATKADLKEALQDFKEEIVDELKKFATKEDVQNSTEEMKSIFESAVERIKDNVLVTQRDHEKRITELERR